MPRVIGEYERRDNIADATLTAYRRHYNDARNPRGEQISKEDMHVNYENVEPHPSITAHWKEGTENLDLAAKYHIQKIAWGKTSGKRSKEFSTLVYNDYLTFMRKSCAL